MSTFTVVNETTLAEAIRRCQSRLAYIAPGITASIVEAMTQVMARAHSPALTVIIDAHPDVFRLGYGTMEGLEALRKLATDQMLPVRYQPGLRVGVLVVDDEVSVYAPTPLLIEAGSTSETRPNAIVLDPKAPTEQLLRACAVEGTDGTNTPLATDAEIGRTAATPELLADSLAELKRLPPKPFDLARIERVYSAKLQYVEFEVSNYKLASKKVSIPNDLLVGDDATLNARLKNSISLLEDTAKLKVQIADFDPRTGQRIMKGGQPALVEYSEQSIERERKQIYDDFLTAIPNHGQLIPKARRKAFDARVEWLLARIEAFKEGIEAALHAAIDESIHNLAEALLPAIAKRPPERLLRHCLSEEPSESDLRSALVLDLRDAFMRCLKEYTPSVRVTFKDLTYETIKDESFRKQLRDRFPGLDEQGVESLFDEHDAAREHR